MDSIDNPEWMDGWDLDRMIEKVRDARRETSPTDLSTVMLGESMARRCRELIPPERWAECGEFMLLTASQQGALAYTAHQAGAPMATLLHAVNITAIAGLEMIDAAAIRESEVHQ
jgi:hypothetical protein